MTKELQTICEKYNFNGDMVKMLTVMEMSYDAVVEIEKDNAPEEESLTMVGWILNNSNLDIMNNCTEKEKFLFGLGALTIELGLRLQL